MTKSRRTLYLRGGLSMASKQIDADKLLAHLNYLIGRCERVIERDSNPYSVELALTSQQDYSALVDAVLRGQFDAEPQTAHPYQPVVIDQNGRAAFKGNKIIEQLFEKGQLNLNKIAQEHYDSECYLQLIQLLGYTLSGSACLRCMTDELYEYGQREAKRLGVEV